MQPAEAEWDADFVHAYSRYESTRQQQDEQRSYSQGWDGAGFDRQSFEEMFRDPFSWFEQQFQRQQQRQRTAQGGYGGGSQQQQWQQQWQRQAGGGPRAAPHAMDPSDPQGYYKILGVKPSATTQELQAAFRGLALQHHPDRYSSPADKEVATKRFQGITEAYQVLRDPSKRRQYNAGQYRG